MIDLDFIGDEAIQALAQDHNIFVRNLRKCCQCRKIKERSEIEVHHVEKAIVNDSGVPMPASHKGIANLMIIPLCKDCHKYEHGNNLPSVIMHRRDACYYITLHFLTKELARKKE